MGHFNNEIINLVDMDAVGLYEDPRFVRMIKPGSKIWLLREPENPRISNAISVHLDDVTGKIGYIPKGIAERLAPILDRGSYCKCSINKKHGNKKTPQISIKLKTYPVARGTPHKPTEGPIIRKNPKTHDHRSPTGRVFRQIQSLDFWAAKHNGKTGIYVIWNKDYKCYVGQSEDIGRRWREHYLKLLSKSHENQKLQEDWFEIGASNFRFDVLEEDPPNMNDAEAYFIDKLNSYFLGYNQTPDGGRIENYMPRAKVDNSGPPVPFFDEIIDRVNFKNEAEGLSDIMGEWKQRECDRKACLLAKENKVPEATNPAIQQQKGSTKPTPSNSRGGLNPSIKVHGTLPPIIKSPDDPLFGLASESGDIKQATIDEAEPTQATTESVDTGHKNKDGTGDPQNANIAPTIWFLVFFSLLALILILRDDPEPNKQIVMPESPIEQYEHYYQVHTVKKGESLSLIAGMYGVDLQDLVQMNGIEDKDLIEVGQYLKIPKQK